MKEIFGQIVNMSISAGVIILFVILTRLLLKRAPKIYSYALWSVVLFRLLCPISLSAPVSLLELTKPEVTEFAAVSTVSYTPVDFVPSQRMEETVTAPAVEGKQTESTTDWKNLAAGIWLTGTGIMLLHSVVSYLRLRHRLADAIPYRKEIYLSDHMDAPFVLGLFRPRIYLPTKIPMRERRFIIAHERHHIRRCDHLIKWLAFLALCIHWFNPLVWVAFVLAGKDMEMSCDEAVVKRLGSHIRADYSASLLRLATGRKNIAGTPLSFGEGDPKGRIRNMAKWKKPKVWVSVLCVLLCIIFVILCAVNPGTGGQAESFGVSVLEAGYEDLTDEAFTSYLRQAYGLESIVDHKVYHKDGAFQVDFLFAESAPDWQLQSAEKFAVDKFYSRDTAKYDVSSYDLWLIEHRNEETKSVVYRIFTEDKLKILGSYPEEEKVPNPETPQSMPLDLAAIPQGYGLKEDENASFSITEGSQVIGGIDAYPIPGGTPTTYDPYFRWLENLGIPDYSDDSLCYMGGGSLYGDWDMHFESDVPPGVESTVNRYHTFIVAENTVYDVWFNMMLVNNNTKDAILSALTGKETYMETVPVNAATFTDLYTSYDGTAEFVVLTGILNREELEAENGVSLEQIMEKAKEEFLATSVNSFGFDPEAMGHEGEHTIVEIYITDLRNGGDYLIAADTPVPTVELWGKRYYHFENGDTMGSEQDAFEIMTINALNGEVLSRFGRK